MTDVAPSDIGQRQEPAAPASGFHSWMIIWLGQFVSSTGSSLTSFGLAVYVFRLTTSATTLGIILALGLLPGVLSSPFAGALVDRWGSRRILLLSSLAGMLITLALALLLAAHVFAVWQVYIIVIVVSLVGAMQVPALAALTPQMVARDQLGRANGLRMVGMAVSQLVAPIAAGFLLLGIHLTGIVIIDLVSYSAAIITLGLVQIPRVHPEPAEDGVRTTLLEEFGEGWRYVSVRPGLRILLFFLAALNFSAGFVELLIMPLVLSFSSARGLGIVLSVGGVGMIVAGVVVNATGGANQRVRALFRYSLLFAVAIIVGALRPSIPLIACAAFVAMGALVLINTTHQPIWQTKVEMRLMGRVMALVTMAGMIPQLTGNILAGVAADDLFDPLVGRNAVRSKGLTMLIGNGPDRGVALLMMLIGVLIIITAAIASRFPRLRHLEAELPDVTAAADDDPAMAPSPAPAM